MGKSRRPTDAELVILRVLWDLGSATVRRVNQALNEARATGYTTTLKQMQVMTAKGLLVRDASCRPQVYRPAAPRRRTEKQLVDHLIAGAFGGSARRLVVQALRGRSVPAGDIARVEKLLDELEGDNA